MQADMVLEKALRVLHPDLQAAGRESDTGPGSVETSKPTASDTLPPTRPRLPILLK